MAEGTLATNSVTSHRPLCPPGRPARRRAGAFRARADRRSSGPAPPPGRSSREPPGRRTPRGTSAAPTRPGRSPASGPKAHDRRQPSHPQSSLGHGDRALPGPFMHRADSDPSKAESRTVAASYRKAAIEGEASSRDGRDRASQERILPLELQPFVDDSPTGPGPVPDVSGDVGDVLGEDLPVVGVRAEFHRLGRQDHVAIEGLVGGRRPMLTPGLGPEPGGSVHRGLH